MSFGPRRTGRPQPDATHDSSGPIRRAIERSPGGCDDVASVTNLVDALGARAGAHGQDMELADPEQSGSASGWCRPCTIADSAIVPRLRSLVVGFATRSAVFFSTPPASYSSSERPGRPAFGRPTRSPRTSNGSGLRLGPAQHGISAATAKDPTPAVCSSARPTSNRPRPEALQVRSQPEQGRDLLCRGGLDSSLRRLRWRRLGTRCSPCRRRMEVRQSPQTSVVLSAFRPPHQARSLGSVSAEPRHVTGRCRRIFSASIFTCGSRSIVR